MEGRSVTSRALYCFGRRLAPPSLSIRRRTSLGCLKELQRYFSEHPIYPLLQENHNPPPSFCSRCKTGSSHEVSARNSQLLYLTTTFILSHHFVPFMKSEIYLISSSYRYLQNPPSNTNTLIIINFVILRILTYSFFHPTIPRASCSASRKQTSIVPSLRRIHDPATSSRTPIRSERAAADSLPRMMDWLSLVRIIRE